MNKKIFSFLFRLLVIASLSMGIYLNISYVHYPIRILSYYTLQINIYCLVNLAFFEIADTFKIKYRNNFYYLIKGEMVISMLFMMMVYAIALMPKRFQMYKFHTQNIVANILVHIISPILIILEYLLLDEKGNFKHYFPLLWIISPVAYIVYVYTYSLLGGRFYNIGGSKKFAYLFLDYEVCGIEKVIFYMVCMAIIVISVGYILFFVDLKLAKKNKREK